MKPGLSLRVSQHLALTPQLQQSIRLLQLSSLELEQEVDQLLLDNPFLERDDDEPRSTLDDTASIDAPPFEGESPESFESEFMPERAKIATEMIASDGAVGDGGNESASDSSGDTSTDAASDTPDWDGDGSTELNANDPEFGTDAPAKGAAPEDDTPWGESHGGDTSLIDHLHRQALGLRLSDTDRALLTLLIESVNDDGYLDTPLAELAESLSAEAAAMGIDTDDLHERLIVALHWLQALEPTGVGARDLAECLRLQIDAATRAAPQDALWPLAARIVAEPLDLLARRDFRALTRLCAASEADLRAAAQRITRLEPKPGRAFVRVEQLVIVPDVIVRARKRRSGASTTPGNEQFQIEINPVVQPRLRVHALYADAMKTQKSEAAQPLQTRLQEAKWFIKNVQQRFDTLLRVSQAIVERQHAFFVRGVGALQPMVMRDIADALGLHESTISRITTAKYMATPQGTFELKYFFTSSLATDSGVATSSTAVRALIEQLVAAENPKKPLSDQALADALKAQGIDCARRTVAKYREELKIPPTTLRKAL